HRLVSLTWKRIYEIIKSRSKFHLKQGHFLSKHWGGGQSNITSHIQCHDNIIKLNDFVYPLDSRLLMGDP
ncbi:MAG: hypothetical protein ACTSRG_26395, partial [Candidatus Helarchaeota archaeon]